MPAEPHLVIDFETRSAADLKKVGSWQYSRHPTTAPLCLCWAYGDEEPEAWIAGFPEIGQEESPPPERLFQLIKKGVLIEAHNAFFERSIWKNVMALTFGWPEVPDELWRCSAAKAAAASLPRSLDELCKALGLSPSEGKDKIGQRALMRLCKPRKPKKVEREQLRAAGVDPDEHVLWHMTAEDLATTVSYCKQDVRSERKSSSLVPELGAKELLVWQLDQTMNERGVHCDVEMARTALKMAEKAREAMNDELAAICDRYGFPAMKASQREKVKAFLSEKFNLDLPDTKAKTLDDWLEDDDEAQEAMLGSHLQSNFRLAFDEDPRRTVQILRNANRTSTKKYEAMLKRADPVDNRLRDIAMYCGANTGRWSGKGVQPHNFPRGGVVELPGNRQSGFKNMDLACDTILTGDNAWAKSLYGDEMDLLSDALRGALTAGPGKVLTVGDFAAIEARVVFWLANCQTALRVFENEKKGGKDIYIDMAQRAYRRELNKKDNPNERQMGKQSILGLGFGMGFPKFLITCRGYGITFTKDFVMRVVPNYRAVEEEVRDFEEAFGVVSQYEELDLERDMHELVFMKYIVDLYRGDYQEVPEFWKNLNDAACGAVLTPGRVTHAGRIPDPSQPGKWRPAIKYKLVGPRLYCKLPSGRSLIYNRPSVKPQKRKNKDGVEELGKPSLHYIGVDQKTKKWQSQHTYGGKLCENVVQATARDLLADSMLAAEANDWCPVMTVHDELVCETDPGVLTAKDLEHLMSNVPEWAFGCPVGAEAWQGRRYRK